MSRGILLTCLTLVLAGAAGRSRRTRRPPRPPPHRPRNRPCPPTNRRRGARCKILTLAMNSADGARIREVFEPRGDIDTKLVDAIVSQQQAMGRFRDASVKAFGAEEAKKLVGDIDADQAQSLAQLDKASEQINGDAATVSFGGDQVIQLKKSGDKWTLPVVTLAPDINAGTIDQWMATETSMVKFADGMTADVASGKYKTADDARNDIQKKRMEQMMSTTQPATAPAGEPAPGAGTQ